MPTRAVSDIAPTGAFSGKLLAGKRSAIVVVDVVAAYLESGSPLFLGPRGAEALHSNLRLCRAARENGVPVILTAVEYDASGRNGGLFFRKVPALKCFVTGSPHGAFPPGLREDGDLLVIKQYASAFFGTTLASTLRALDVDTLIITGFSTSGCVRATAVDAIQNGFAPFVVREACADRSEAPHEANLFDIGAKYGEVIDEATAFEILAAGAAARA